MALQIASHDGAAPQKRQIFKVRFRTGRNRSPAGGKPSTGTSRPKKPVPNTGLDISSVLLKVNESQKFVENVDDMLGIHNLNASFFFDSRTDRRVVQLRNNESKKLVRQVPTPEFLNRVAQMRKFIGRNFDVKV